MMDENIGGTGIDGQGPDTVPMELPKQEGLQGTIQPEGLKDLKEAAVKDNCAIITDGPVHIAIEALSDHVIILEDKFKTGYECTTCQGESYLNEQCSYCKGSGRENIGLENESLCRICCPPNMQASGGMQAGKQICPSCQGKGSLIIAPEISRRRATSGIVKSIGPEVKVIRIGDKALYGMFAGTAINFKQKGVIRIMHEHEVMSRLYGVSKIGEWIR
jgi:hypothetical protein